MFEPVYTKLYPPPTKPELVSRPRLLKRLDAVGPGSVLLVAAPAGYGKSTLLGQWLDTRSEPCAWLSLDESDDDLRVFLNYFVASVRTAVPEACETTSTLLSATALPSTPILTRSLINDLDAIPMPFVVVLDDYHRIRESEIHQVIDLLLEHPPREMRLVLAARRDPPLALAKLLANGRMIELRLDELQFTPPETAALLEAESGIQPSDTALENVRVELEGWGVGLKLLGLVLRGHENPERMMTELQGGLPNARAYLMTEVLRKEPRDVREWLLKTSILSRFCPSLCDALFQSDDGPTGMNGERFVGAIQHGHLFCISLDAGARWFRYHHEFRRMLHRQLEDQMPSTEIESLHARASAWFETQGMTEEAVDHALAAMDPQRAADVLERRRVEEFGRMQVGVVERCLKKIPPEIREQRLGLLMGHAWMAVERSQLAQVPAFVQRIEALIEHETPEPALLGELRCFQGVLGLFAGDGKGARARLEEAAELIPPDQHFHGSALEFLGLAVHATGEHDAAVSMLEKALASSKLVHPQIIVRLRLGLSMVHQLDGDLPRTLAASHAMYRANVNRATDAYYRSFSAFMQGWARLHACELLPAVDGFAETTTQRFVVHSRAALDALAGLALADQLLARDENADDALQHLTAFAHEIGDPSAVAIADSSRARVRLLRGDVASALRWARAYDHVPVGAELWMWLEVPALTKARALIAAATVESLQTADELLQQLQEYAAAYRLSCQSIEILTLQSLLLERRGEEAAALATLSDALAAAQPRGYLRPFVEGGPAMAGLLKRLAKSSAYPTYAGEVLMAFGTGAASPAARRPLIDPLTNREEEVLGLLGRHLRYKDIAAELSISTDTVKYHLRNSYQKLQVGNRRDAVLKARSLGLFSDR